MTTKNILIGLIMLAVFIWIDKLLSKHHYDVMCLFDRRTYNGKRISIEEGNLSKNETVYILGLGDFNQADLETASKEITEVFGFKCKIIDPVKTTPELYVTNTNRLDKDKCLTSLNPKNKTVYVKNESLNSKNTSGSAKKNGKFIIISNTGNHVRKTVLHEMGHTLGMDHCDNNKCVMATRNIMTCNGQFCNNCKTKLGLK